MWRTEIQGEEEEEEEEVQHRGRASHHTACTSAYLAYVFIYIYFFEIPNKVRSGERRVNGDGWKSINAIRNDDAKLNAGV